MQTSTKTIAGLLLAGSVAATAAGCGSSGSTSAKSSTNPLDPKTATSQVTALYQRFFSEPQSQATADLQDGSSLGKAIAVAAKVKGSAKEGAKVKSVKLDLSANPPSATVVYALLSNGKVVLPSSTGMAVYVNGKWLFAKETFCGLVSLTGTTPPGCPKA